MEISIHAPRGGSDHGGAAYPDRPGHFNPRSPWGERLAPESAARNTMPFQSTLPVGGATACRVGDVDGSGISIHAPRGGSDACISFLPSSADYFNPRSPWGERHFV